MVIGNNSTHTERLLQELHQGDRTAIDRLLNQHRPWLRKLIRARMDAAVQRRVDPSDVLQETFLAAAQRIDEYLERRPAAFRLWLRRTAIERLIDIRRVELAQKRNAALDVGLSDASSLAMARGLLSNRPSELLRRRELADSVRRALALLPESDRDVLIYRHVELLTNNEVAEMLETTTDAARKRYGRALLRLSQKLQELGIRSVDDV